MVVRPKEGNPIDNGSTAYIKKILPAGRIFFMGAFNQICLLLQGYGVNHCCLTQNYHGWFLNRQVGCVCGYN